MVVLQLVGPHVAAAAAAGPRVLPVLKRPVAAWQLNMLLPSSKAALLHVPSLLLRRRL